jgi:hypothetical protein
MKRGAALAAFLLALEEVVSKIVDEFGNLLLLPLVFALIVINRILVPGGKLPDGTPLDINGT